ncbi:uncharacterized protein UTRI_10049 [Ustilago trichophora]|uniref:Mig1 protein n=1 Tax=Ustilago trichophora TaxID=86804 RepID=A0A5C3DT05_9BASI|nr:uncharacterized protein UTRI_10049 [Ustilago trichophora]
MKVTSACFLYASALFGIVGAGWMPDQPKLSWDLLCGSGATASQTSHVCLVAQESITGFAPQSDFRGFKLSDDRNFVLYQDNRDAAFWQNDRYIISVNFNIAVGQDTNCAVYQIEKINGGSKDGFYCGGPPIPLS